MPTRKLDSEGILAKIVGMIESELPRSELEVLISAIFKNDFAPGFTGLEHLDAPPELRDRLQTLLVQLRRREELVALYLALTVIRERKETPRIDICLTHPMQGIHERIIWPAVSEVITSARSRITVVGYGISSSPSVIFDNLVEKSKEGVELVFLVDRLEDKKDFLQWARSLPYQPELYGRAEDPADPKSSLHIKCIIVDDDVAIIGSANPTYHGMMKNIEICLVFRDREVVMRISRIVDQLKRELVRHSITSQ